MTFDLTERMPELPTETGTAGAVHFTNGSTKYSLHREAEDLWIIQQANTSTSEYVIHIRNVSSDRRSFDAEIAAGSTKVSANGLTLEEFFSTYV